MPIIIKTILSILLLFFTLCSLIICGNNKNEANTQFLSNKTEEIIHNDTNLNENDIFGIWYVIEINGKINTTTLHGFVDNPAVKIYDTVESGIYYKFDEQKRFYDNRLDFDGIWAVEKNTLKTETVVPMHKDDKIIGYYEINRNYIVNIIDNNYAVFQYKDNFTGNEIIERVVKWNKEIFELIKNKKISDIMNFFDVSENRYLLGRKYENDITLLMYALSIGRGDVANLLIEKGVDVNEKNIFDMTALHYACLSEKAEYYFDVIEKLLKAGANVNSIDILGQTPLDYTLFDPNAFTDFIKNIQLILKMHGGQYGNSIREEYARSIN